MEKILQAIKLSLVEDKKHFWQFALGLMLFFSSLGLFAIYFNYYQSRFYPQVYIDQVAIGGLSYQEAKIKLEQVWAKEVKNLPLYIVYDPAATESTQIQLLLSNDFSQKLEQAQAVGHQGGWFKRLLELAKKQEFYTTAKLDETSLLGALATLGERFDQTGRLASATLSSSGNLNTLSIDPGSDGRVIQIDQTVDKIYQQLTKPWLELKTDDLLINALVASTSAQLDSEELRVAKERAQKIVGKNLLFTGEYQRAEFSDRDLIASLRFPDGINEQTLDESLLMEIIADRTQKINRPAQNASFKFHRDDQEKIVIDEFIPDLKGLKVDEEQLLKKIKQSLDWLEAEKDLSELDNENEAFFQLAMTSTEAEINLAKTNDFGIEEIIGFGESWYYHSIPSRVHNVSVASDKLHLYLIAPGKEFSFNRAIGEVTLATGYQSAYIIQGGETLMAPGGGVCQVSSTLFRALLDAGVKITRRLPHSYRVSYYEIGNEPGFDATVYSGNVDLRFINDTPGHLLLAFEAFPKDLYMTVKIYGTNDGRSNEIINYKKWGYAPAPAPIYIPDPNLPTGKLKQVDWASSGIKAEFTNVIKDKNDEVIREDYYYSSYQPWSAKYLQGI